MARARRAGSARGRSRSRRRPPPRRAPCRARRRPASRSRPRRSSGRAAALLAPPQRTSSSGAPSALRFRDEPRSPTERCERADLARASARRCRTASTMSPVPASPLVRIIAAPSRDPAQRFAEIAAAAHERDAECVLVDVELLVGGRQHLALVDEVDLERLEDPRLHEVSDAALGHDRDAHRLLDGADHRRIARARDAAVLADLRRHALERHHRDGARLFGDLGLLGVDDVHDDAALRASPRGPPSSCACSSHRNTSLFSSPICSELADSIAQTSSRLAPAASAGARAPLRSPARCAARLRRAAPRGSKQNVQPQRPRRVPSIRRIHGPGPTRTLAASASSSTRSGVDRPSGAASHRTRRASAASSCTPAEVRARAPRRARRAARGTGLACDRGARRGSRDPGTRRARADSTPEVPRSVVCLRARGAAERGRATM